MGQLEFFDADKRLAALSAKGDPLEAIDRLVPWDTFRANIEAVVLTPEEMRKSSAGRKTLDAIVMFRMLVCRRSTIFRTSRRSIRCVIGCHSRDFCGWASRTAFLTPPRSGCSARSLPRPGSLRGYSTASTSTSLPKATWRVVGRWLMPRLCRFLRSATVAMRTRR